ncbi:MAG: hypothetical protein R2769_04570 [Saprospiraceae bacterium]
MKYTNIQWFELPSGDFERGKTFYETIFDIEMKVLDLGEFKWPFFQMNRAVAPLSTTKNSIILPTVVPHIFSCRRPDGYHPWQSRKGWR